VTAINELKLGNGAVTPMLTGDENIVEATAAAALWALGTVLGRYLAREIAFQHVLSLRFFFGFLASAIALLVMNQPAYSNGHDTVLILYLALVTGLLALALYYFGLQRTPAMMASIAFAIGAKVSGGSFFSSWAFTTSPSRRAAVVSSTRPSTGTRKGGEDRDEAALAVADQDDLRKLLAVAKVADQRRRIVDVILEAEVFGVAELRFPSARAALVIAERRDAARGQLFGELLQRGRFDLRPVAIMVDRAGARDEKRNGWPLNSGQNGEIGIRRADPDFAFLGARGRGESKNQKQVCNRSRDRPHLIRSCAPLPAA